MDGAPRRSLDPRQDLNERGLSRTIAAQNRHSISDADSKGDAIEDTTCPNLAAEFFDDPVDDDSATGLIAGPVVAFRRIVPPVSQHRDQLSQCILRLPSRYMPIP